MLYKEKTIPGNGFETFSTIFDLLPCDERRYIEEVVRMWTIQANYFPYEEYLSSVDFEEVEQYFDVGYLPTLISYGPVFRNAQQKGIRILLDGMGGDNLSSVSYDHLSDLLEQGNIRKLINQFRHDAAISSYSSYSLFLNYCLKPFIPHPIKVTLKGLLKCFRGNGLPSWINTNCLKKAEMHNCPRMRFNSKQFPTRSQQRIYEGLLFGLNATLVIDEIGKFIAHFGMENRHPFFDRRLVEFLIAVPEEQRWCNEWPKAILRRAMNGILPESVRLRKDKTEFSSTIDLEFKKRQTHKLETIICSSVLASLELINSSALQQLFERYRNGISDDSIRNTLQTFVWLELWCRSATGIGKGE
jgi:asparagine synthase (glutamine-hydrolysing)